VVQKKISAHESKRKWPGKKKSVPFQAKWRRKIFFDAVFVSKKWGKFIFPSKLKRKWRHSRISGHARFGRTVRREFPVENVSRGRGIGNFRPILLRDRVACQFFAENQTVEPEMATNEHKSEAIEREDPVLSRNDSVKDENRSPHPGPLLRG
jgi:hypothetical protein